MSLSNFLIYLTEHFCSSGLLPRMKWLAVLNTPRARLHALRDTRLGIVPSTPELLDASKQLIELIRDEATEYKEPLFSLFQGVSAFHDLQVAADQFRAADNSKQSRVHDYQQLLFDLKLPFPNKSDDSELPCLVTSRTDDEAIRQYVLTCISNRHAIDNGLFQFIELMLQESKRCDNRQGVEFLETASAVIKQVHSRFYLAPSQELRFAPFKDDLCELLFKQLFAARLSIAKELLISYDDLFAEFFADWTLRGLKTSDQEAAEAVADLIRGTVDAISAREYIAQTGYLHHPLVMSAFAYFHSEIASALIRSLIADAELDQIFVAFEEQIQVAREKASDSAVRLLEDVQSVFTYKQRDNNGGAPVASRQECDVTEGPVEKFGAQQALAIWDVLSLVQQATRDNWTEEALARAIASYSDLVRTEPNLSAFLLMQFEECRQNPNFAYYLASAAVQVASILGQQSHRLAGMQAHNVASRALGRYPKYSGVNDQLQKHWEEQDRPDMHVKLRFEKANELIERGALREGTKELEKAIDECRVLIKDPLRLPSTVVFEGRDVLRVLLDRYSVLQLNLGNRLIAAEAMLEIVSQLEEEQDIDDYVSVLEKAFDICQLAGYNSVANHLRERARAAAETASSPMAKFHVTRRDAALLALTGRPDAAYLNYLQAIEYLRSAIRHIGFHNDRTAFTYEHESVYVGALDCCVSAGKFAEAVQIQEAQLCRSLLDLLSISGSVDDRDLDNDTRETLARLQSLTFPSGAPRPYLPEEYKQRIQTYDSGVQKCVAYPASVRNLRLGIPASIEELRDALVEAGPRTAALYLRPGLTESHTWLVEIDESSSTGLNITYAAIDLGAQKIKRFVNGLYDNLPLVRGYGSQEWTAFSEKWIGHLADRIGSISHLYVIPYGDLCRLPLHYFQLGDCPLIERVSVTYVPSIGVLRYCVSMQTTCFSGFGIHCAPEFIEEERLVGACFEVAPIRLDQIARHQECDGLLKGKKIIHLGCHGVIDHADSWNSILRFNASETGKTVEISARELSRYCFRGAVVVLAACSTGMVSENERDGISTLATALFYAGARTVVTSLWEADAGAILKLTERMYARLKLGGSEESVASAFQQAILQTAREETGGYSTMMRDAPLIVIGNGGRL